MQIQIIGADSIILEQFNLIVRNDEKEHTFEIFRQEKDLKTPLVVKSVNG